MEASARKPKSAPNSDCYDLFPSGSSSGLTIIELSAPNGLPSSKGPICGPESERLGAILIGQLQFRVLRACAHTSDYELAQAHSL